MSPFSSKTKANRKKRDLEIYTKYHDYMKEENALSTSVVAFLMEQYDISSPTTIYNILKRVGKELKASK